MEYRQGAGGYRPCANANGGGVARGRSGGHDNGWEDGICKEQGWGVRHTNSEDSSDLERAELTDGAA